MARFFRKYWRQILFLGVLLTAWVAFLSSPMPGTESPERYFIAMYYAATLFIFGALDIGFPQAGSNFVVVVLWACYFIAPLFTISYAYTLIEERLLNRLPFNLRKHSVILGMGRTGTFMYDTIREQDPHEKIVIVDRNVQNPLIPLYEQARSVWWIKNDFEKEESLTRAKVQKAKRAYITTNNDLANLTAAFKCLDLNPEIERIYCHLQNYVMHKDFVESLDRIPQYSRIKVFNAYTSAAQEVLKLIEARENDNKTQGRILIFMGFGHFGHTLFDDMIADQDICKDDEIIIVTLKTKLFFDTLNYEWSKGADTQKCTLHKPIYDDIYTAGCWEKMNRLVKGKDKQVIAIACLDDPEANISLAIQIKKKGPESLRSAIFYCRTFKPLSKQLQEILENSITETEGRDIIPFSLEEALNRAYSDLLKE
jgi:hypothetical protein